MSENTDYLRLRGKCKEMSKALVESNPKLMLERGWYICPIWGKQAHWWCVDEQGEVVDPTKDQFPSKGEGFYVPFDGMHECECCGKHVSEDEVYQVDHHLYCSHTCYGRDVMG